MDLSSSNFLEAPPALFQSQIEARLEGKNGNPFLDTFPDPACKLNLRETSEFVKSIPAAQRRNSVTKKSVVEAPSTPGRPIFSFSVGNFSRKSVPSKWDDAEKWVVNGSSCNDSPAHSHGSNPPECLQLSKYCNGVQSKDAVFAKKSRVEEDEKIPKASNGVSATSNLILKENADKFTKEEDTGEKPRMEAVKKRDIGTEMTPTGSCTASRCHTPVISSSPARHNTPADRSGPLDVVQLQECDLAKLQYDSVTWNWSSREEEEEDVSKSLRHFEVSNECQRSKAGAYPWEEEIAKCCLRYRREEAQIQAWVNLQTAKAEAQSKKLEVKIQKMRSKMEEKLIKRMAIVCRKAEEQRAAARLQHFEQMQKVSAGGRKIVNRQKNIIKNVSTRPTSCSCFPCNSHHM